MVVVFSKYVSFDEFVLCNLWCSFWCDVEDWWVIFDVMFVVVDLLFCGVGGEVD